MKACYIHVPFCKEICAYCDFMRCRYHQGLAQKWLSAIQQEIEAKLSVCTDELTTLYIGGGTPSALAQEELKQLLVMLDPYRRKVIEYTVEANVESLDSEKIALLKAHGVNRISLGVQSLQPSLLRLIHRQHQKGDVLSCIQQLRQAGITNISIDLIYGLPTQTLAMWQSDLQEIVTHFPITHISLYALTIEEHSQFGRDGVENIDPDVEADMFEYAIAFLKAHGFTHYEISNFAKEGKASLHNQMYWHYEDFCGIGCGASGKANHVRYDNTLNLHTYLTQGPTPAFTPLTKADEMFEYIMMGLRLQKGIALSDFKQRFQVALPTQYACALAKNIASKRLVMEDGYVKATYAGMLMLHDVLEDFLP